MIIFQRKDRNLSDEKLNTEDGLPKDTTAKEYYQALAQVHKEKQKSSLKTFLRTGIFTCAAVIVIVLGSIAWFANNRDVRANGISIEGDVSSNLVISDNAEELKTANFALTVSNPFVVDFPELNADNLPNLTAATHDWSVGTETGLKYNTNPSKVGVENGLADDSTDVLKFAAVPEYNEDTDSYQYYIDYTVYIAAIGKEITIKNLNASVFADAPEEDADNQKEYLKAASVDFYIGSVSSDNYMGTLNVAGQDCENTKDDDDNLKALTSIDIAVAHGSEAAITTVPLNTSGNCITVVMRLYFDGALLKSDGQAYVYSDQLSLSDFNNMTVRFDAVE